jgi:hypothetical protein
MNDIIYAVSEDELGDIFFGTISQFQDCYCSNVMETLEDVEFHAKGMFGDNIIVEEVDPILAEELINGWRGDGYELLPRI